MILYKKFMTIEQYNFEDQCYYGTLAGIDDSVLIKGKNMEEFQKDFRKAVDNYIEKNNSKESLPPKANTKFCYARIPAELHAKIVEKAKRSGKKINQFIIDALEKSLK